jgi:hypothetical protein
MFTAAKDKLAGQAAKAYVQGLIKAYGRVEFLSIDSAQRRIHFRCTLEGEVEPIEFAIGRYAVERGATGAFVRILECTASRRWLEVAAREHLIGRRFELPDWAAAVL